MSNNAPSKEPATIAAKSGDVAPVIAAAGIAAMVGFAISSPMAGSLSGPLWGMLALGCAALGYWVGRKWATPAALGAHTKAEMNEATSAAAQRVMSDVIDAMDLPAFMLDREDMVVTLNAAVRELLPEAAASRPLHQVTRSPALLEATQRAHATGAAQSCEINGRGPTNRRLLVSVAPFTLAAAAGSTESAPSHLLLQFRDLTEQDRLMQLRTDFIANASHELRTPLASIKGFVETLQGPAASDQAARQKFLGIMQAQTSRMARILDDLLSLSRIEMREHVKPSDHVNLTALLRATVDGLDPIAREAHITLRYAPDPVAIQVRGDRDELLQLFQNLIQNAIKYGRENGTVEITLASPPAQPGQKPKVVVSVRDDGPGISAEHLPRLTERFYRVDTATSRARGGTGLGLAIVKHIVSRHRGELKIQSELGKGSTFIVTLDTAPETARNIQAKTTH